MVTEAMFLLLCSFEKREPNFHANSSISKHEFLFHQKVHGVPLKTCLYYYLTKAELTRNPQLLGNLKDQHSFFLQLPEILNITTSAEQK